MEKGTLYGVSVGPGDPELMTLKAVRMIRSADVVAVPDIGHGRQTARCIAGEHLEGKHVVSCPTPMTRDHARALESYERNADTLCSFLDAGLDVAYLVLGDATVYSSYMYVHRIVCARGYDASIVPGVTSFCAAAARLGRALCEGSERLLIAPGLAADLDETLDIQASTVFMKTGHALPDLLDKLSSRGLAASAGMVANCGLPDERVFETLEGAQPQDAYFSVVLVPSAPGQEH